MTDSNLWPEDYFDSRAQFLALAQGCGARMESHGVNPVGPNGEALTIDIAAFISDQDDHRIILTSGVHGVEGFIGASIQMEALRLLKQSALPNRIGIIMIHAVNPWGFAHLRRVNENNIDVNRNFINFEQTKPTSPEQYAALDPVINPQKAPGTIGEIIYWLRAGKLIAQHRGIEKLVKPIAEGQSDYPQGLFFSGTNVSQSCAVLQEVVLTYSENVKHISLLDVHSGLGPSGQATLIGNTNIGLAENRLSSLQTHYQQRIIMDNAVDNTYNAQGSFSQWCAEAFSYQQFLYLCVEIGTVNPIKLFSALRRENQSHHWSSDNTKSYTHIKHALRNVFAPESTRWRKKALAEGRQVLASTIDLPLNLND